MKVNVLVSPSAVEELYFSNKTVVVIDVLRATTTIVTALENGAKELIPVHSIEFAMKASSSMFGGQTLIGGERNTRKIDGFNLGNSPLEYTAENIAGKSIILFTTNGSKAIVKTKYSKTTLIGSFLNVTSIAEYLVSQREDVVEVVCSGANGLFCMEDTVCAGLIVREIQKMNPEVVLTDGARAAVDLSGLVNNDIYKMLVNSDHGKLLLDNGFEKDITYCSRVNVSTIVPQYSTGAIKVSK
jgi:2-phosphosulfolactate phosphatase